MRKAVARELVGAEIMVLKSWWRRGFQSLRQAPEWLELSWSFDNSVMKDSAAGRLLKIAHSHSCAIIEESSSQVFKCEFHCGRGNVNRGFSRGTWANWVHDCVGARSFASASATELPSEKNLDEIVDLFEKLLQKWSSNTPMLLEDLQVQLTPAIVCRVLKVIPRSDAARKFFNWAKTQNGFEHNVYTYTSMIDFCGKKKNLQGMEQVLVKMREEGCETSIVTFSSLMHWYRQAKNLAGVRRVWAEMLNEGFEPNEYTYTTYIDALAKGGCHQEALEVFNEMQFRGCRPNIFTYTVLIHTLAEARKLEGARELFDKLADLQLRPNSVTYAILVWAHEKEGELEKAIYFYKKMLESGLTPSLPLRMCLSKALIVEGRVREAEDLTHTTRNEILENKKQNPSKEEAPQSGLPRPQKLAELLQDWGPETEKALKRVRLKLRKPYIMNVLTLLGAYPEPAWRFYQWLKRQDGFTPTKHMSTKVLDIIGNAGNTQLQREILEKAETENEANTVSFNTLIKSYCGTRHTDAALQVFAHMKERGFEPNVHTYTMLIDLLSRTHNHARAMEMYGQMKKANCKPTIHTFTVIVHSLARSNKVNAANTLFEKLSTMGMPPSTVTYTIMLQAFIKTGELEKALHLYKKMQSDGLTPSRATIRVLTKGLHFAGRHDEADALSNTEPHFEDPVLSGSRKRTSQAKKDVQSLLSKYFM